MSFASAAKIFFSPCLYTPFFFLSTDPHLLHSVFGFLSVLVPSGGFRRACSSSVFVLLNTEILRAKMSVVFLCTDQNIQKTMKPQVCVSLWQTMWARQTFRKCTVGSESSTYSIWYTRGIRSSSPAISLRVRVSSSLYQL